MYKSIEQRVEEEEAKVKEYNETREKTVRSMLYEQAKENIKAKADDFDKKTVQKLYEKCDVQTMRGQGMALDVAIKEIKFKRLVREEAAKKRIEIEQELDSLVKGV